MPLSPYQKAFLGFDLVSKDNVVDPETGELVDWAALASDEATVTNIFESNTFITEIKNQPNGVAGLDSNAKVPKNQTRYLDKEINFIIGDGLAVVSTGLKGFLHFKYPATILSVTMLSDVTGSCVVDIWKRALASHPPADAQSITASAPATISSNDQSYDATLTGWTKAIAAGDVLAFNVDSASTVKLVTVMLELERD